jgi:magnesium chelatase subunit I
MTKYHKFDGETKHVGNGEERRMALPATLGELRRSGYKVQAVKDEIRNNLIRKLEQREPLFPGIIGYEQTVVPSMVNAILARHDILLLGLRGQAKSRIVRQLPSLLDEYIPFVKGCEINDDPFKPVCKRCNDLLKEQGEALEIEWLHRDRRFGEKLATPDVTIADLIGDIDPIKAAAQRLHYSHEGAIHYGIIPRTNRGIFAINELPDLQPRIQVGLFNIMEEKDIQIRGFNIRIPLDLMIVFTANPEDYTNRGNLITPLKDRIDSQILTHYPRSIEDSIKITEQEAWIHRNGRDVQIPYYFREIIEQTAFEARKSEYVDQKSGVSARFTISAMENLVSNAERRAILVGDRTIVPRICDLAHALPGMTGKVELVFEGEQEGPAKVSKALVGKAVREVFKRYFPDPLQKRTKRQGEARPQEDSEYAKIVSWFESGNKIEIADDMPLEQYLAELNKAKGLLDITKKHLKLSETNKYELASAMEFVLDGLHQSSRIAKDEVDRVTAYKDLVGSIFTNTDRNLDEDL